MKIEWRRLEEIRPYERNPRVNDGAVDVVAESLREFGWRQPIVVDEDGVIIVGHTRWKAAVKLGMESVPVHVAAGLTPEQVRAYRIADNKTSDYSDWDYDLLPLELRELADGDYDLALTGFSEDELAEMLGDKISDGLTDPDMVPEPPDEAITQPGDLWLLGEHRLLCGDSSSPEDVDRLLDGATIHLVNMDPPYNVNVQPRTNMGISRPKDRPLLNDSMSDEEYATMLLAWFGNASRVLIPGGGFYIWGGCINLDNYPPALKACGLYFSQAIVWDKRHPVLTRKDFMGAFELTFYGWKKGAAHRFFGPHNIRDLWSDVLADEWLAYECERSGCRAVLVPADIDLPADIWHVKKVNPQSMIHLTEKPVELAIRAIRYSSRPGENVLDLFGGSGSTLIGCEQTGRCAYLMELDPLYCDVIVERWEKFTGRKAEVVNGWQGKNRPTPTYHRTAFPVVVASRPEEGRAGRCAEGY